MNEHCIDLANGPDHRTPWERFWRRVWLAVRLIGPSGYGGWILPPTAWQVGEVVWGACNCYACKRGAAQ